MGGFTSYLNSHIKCFCLPDELYRLKMVLEAHMGTKGKCVVTIKTLAKELRKTTKTVGRNLKKLREQTNLTMKKVGKGLVYEYSTKQDMNVTSKGNSDTTYYGTVMYPITPHQCPTRKINSKNKNIKDNTSNISNKPNNEGKIVSSLSNSLSSGKLSVEIQEMAERLIRFLEEQLNTRLTYPLKQAYAIKSIMDAGYTEKQITAIIKYMATDDEFYSKHGFDLITLANHIGKIVVTMDKRWKQQAWQYTGEGSKDAFDFYK